MSKYKNIVFKFSSIDREDDPITFFISYNDGWNLSVVRNYDTTYCMKCKDSSTIWGEFIWYTNDNVSNNNIVVRYDMKNNVALFKVGYEPYYFCKPSTYTLEKCPNNAKDGTYFSLYKSSTVTIVDNVDDDVLVKLPCSKAFNTEIDNLSKLITTTLTFKDNRTRYLIDLKNGKNITVFEEQIRRIDSK